MGRAERYLHGGSASPLKIFRCRRMEKRNGAMREDCDAAGGGGDRGHRPRVRINWLASY